MTQEHAELELAGERLDVYALDGRDAVSELFEYRVACRESERWHEPREVLGQSVTITLRSAGLERSVAGIIARATRRVRDDDSSELLVVVRPPAHRLTLGRSCRTFQDQNVASIVDRLLITPHRWELSESYPIYPYRAQYRESDFGYVARLLEEEGIYYWFDHEDGSIMVLSDNSVAAPDLAGGAGVRFAPESDLVARRELVFELASHSTALATRVDLGSFSSDKPTDLLRASAGDGSFATYDAPGAGPTDEASLGRRARVLAETAQAARRGVAGQSSSPRLTPGRMMELAGHPADRFNARYLIVEARHRVVQRSAERGGERAYECRFSAVRADVRYRPIPRTPAVGQAGLQSGVVVGAPGEEIFLDGQGRARVQLHWDREGARDAGSGRWMRVAQRGTAGSMLLPRVGWNVLSFNEEGSVDAPSVLSRIHDGEHPPSHALPANKTRVVFQTATSPGGGSSNELHYEDQTGAEVMFMNASRDMSLLVKNEKTEQVAANVTRSVGCNQDVSVAGIFSETVGGNQSFSVAGNDAALHMGDRGHAVAGNESTSIGAGRSLETGVAHQTMVQGERRLEVGSSLIDSVIGPISSSAGGSHHVMVGAAALRLTAQSISESVQQASAQTIGGAKLEITGGARTIETKLLHNEMVGAAMVLKTDKSFKSTSEMATSYAVGGVFSSRAPTLTIEAEQSIVLSCGASSLTITSENIELTSTSFKIDAETSDLIDAQSPRIDHN